MASDSGTGIPALGGQFNPGAALLDTFFPGFSLISATIHRYLQIDPAKYVPYLLLAGLTIFGLSHASTYIWCLIESYLMSTADIRVDDEMYNIFMAWLTQQYFAKNSRRFVANTNVNSRNWQLVWESRHGDDEKDQDKEDDEIEFENADGDVVPGGVVGKRKNRKMQYTPSFGTHYFWYKGCLLLFKREKNNSQSGYLPASEREEISVSCFGRNPEILKTLLNECRVSFLKQDENKTLIYRGGVKSGSTDPTWTRSMSRVSRPFSTVVLEDSIKKALVDDLKDYLHPYTRRWYSNRGIPYRRGYLLYGPPGTGKSSLSFAIAGYFNLKIYIVSLNSQLMSEENLGTLFAELPKSCVVLLEDIDTAGLTHTRDDGANKQEEEDPKPPVTTIPGKPTPPPENKSGRLSLSALLNVIDGVASQEGRVLIMTTNHIEKLDEALIRPGRVDMMVEFNLANSQQLVQIFEGIFATLEGDYPTGKSEAEKRLARTRGSPANSLPPPTGAETKSIPSKSPDGKESDSAAEKQENGHVQYVSGKEHVSIPTSKKENSKAAKARISALAQGFAKEIPSGKFSPAEIQGFLLKWKRDPEMAVKKASEWVEEMRIKKEKSKDKSKGGLTRRGTGIEVLGKISGDSDSESDIGAKSEVTDGNGSSGLAETPISITPPLPSPNPDGTQSASSNSSLGTGIKSGWQELGVGEVDGDQVNGHHKD